MASAPAPKSKVEVPALPTSFPPNQLFVAVADHDGAAAGFDGGPERGGSGAWARGDVRPWTAEHAVPLALRDPKDGTIARGYVEPVLDMGNDGKVLRSGKFFANRDPKTGEWVAAEPTPKAVQRATRGASSMTKAFQTIGVQQAVAARDNAMAAAGIPMDRPSDRMVG